MRALLLASIVSILCGCEVRTPPAELSVASAVGPVSKDWPCLMGPSHDSVSGERSLINAFPASGPRELWRRDVGTGYSSPIVANGRLVVFFRRDDDEVIECLDAASGELHWSYKYPTAWDCKYEYSNGPYSTPAIDDGVVYAVGAEAKLHALDLASGDLLWQRDLKADYEPQALLFCHGASPLVDGERLYYTLGGSRGNSGTICLDKRTGETLWTATDHAAGYATPVAATIHGRGWLFVFDHYGLVALDPDSGEVRWEIAFQSRAPDTVCATSPVVQDDLVMVTLGPAPGALCVRVLPDGTYEEVWRERRVIDSTWNNVAHVGRHAFGYTSKRIRSQFRSFDLATGDVRWEWESDLERGSVLVADGKLICFGEHGHLALLKLDPQKCKVLAITKEPLLASPCYPMPALADGRLYLKNTHAMACYEFRADR